MSAPSPRRLVLDTSVDVKWYLREEHSQEAVMLLSAAADSRVEFLAPSTLMPEFFNTLWQRHRRHELKADEITRLWEDFRSGTPITLYDPSDLVERAAELVFETGSIIYDALFIALAEYSRTVVVTADTRLIKTLESTGYSQRVHSLGNVASLL